MGPRERILIPYTRRVDDMAHRLRKLFWSVLLITLAIFMGFAIAILPVNLIVIPAMPIVLLVLVALWMAPDIDPKLDRTFRYLFLAFLGTQLVWPHYVALRTPGIGYVTPPRLVMFALVAVGLWMLATSARIRGVLAGALNGAPVVKWAFIIFMALQVVLAVVTVSLSGRWFSFILFWYLVFLFAVVAFSYEDMPRRFATLILLSVPVLTLFAWWEYQSLYKVWMAWIPPILQGDPAIWNKIIEGMMRAGTTRYRASGLLMNSVTLGEFIALVIPFIIHLAFDRFGGWKRWLAVPLVIVCVLGMHAAGSRTAYAGGLVGIGIYSMLVTWRNYNRTRKSTSLLGPAAVWAYPVAGLLAFLAVQFVGRVRRLVLGGAEHAPSDAGRDRQWEATWQRVFENPFGHGPGSSGRVIGITNPDGSITIDGWYMNLLLEFGVLGTVCYILIFAGAVYAAGKVYLRAATRDEELGAAFAASMGAFLVTRYVLSLGENHPMMFSMAGLAVALLWRQELRLRKTQGTAGKAEAESRSRRFPGGRPARPALAAARNGLSRA
ncbi:MAG: O-antigen ligase family protein [Sphingomonadaceae bacterium]